MSAHRRLFARTLLAVAATSLAALLAADRLRVEHQLGEARAARAVDHVQQEQIQDALQAICLLHVPDARRVLPPGAPQDQVDAAGRARRAVAVAGCTPGGLPPAPGGPG